MFSSDETRNHRLLTDFDIIFHNFVFASIAIPVYKPGTFLDRKYKKRFLSIFQNNECIIDCIFSTSETKASRPIIQK